MEFETRDEDLFGDSFEAIGAELASARVANGIQIAELAQLLRISRQYIKDLETGDYSNLPEPTYVSGYIRSIARELGLDGEVMSQRYRALLDSSDHKPTYQFPIDTQQPQRSGAMIASILVMFAVAGYGGWYVAGKPDLIAGMVGSAGPEVAVTTPQVDITATEPDDLISGDPDQQLPGQPVIAPADIAAAALDTSADAGIDVIGNVIDDVVNDVMGTTDGLAGDQGDDLAGNLALGQPIDDVSPAPSGDGGGELAAVAAAPAVTNATLVDGAAPAELAAVDTSSIDTLAVDQLENAAPQTELAIAADSPSAVPDNGPVTAGDAAAGIDLAASSDPVTIDQPAQTSGAGVAFARQRLPELEITVRATGTSWVEIIRNDGEEVMTKLMREGEVYVVDSRDRLYLSTGNAGGLELLFHDGSVRPIGESGEILRDLPLDADRLRNQL